MTLPSASDIKKRQDKLDGMLKKLNEDGSMSESKICTSLRKAVRDVWMMHDVKISYILKKSYPDMNPHTRTKWLIDCECCGEAFKTGDIQVDHIKGEHALRTLNDLIDFVESILRVSHDDLQIMCVTCHEAKTYAERYDMPLEDAFKEKVVIKKINQTVKDQKEELKGFGYTPKEFSNEDKRRECYRELFIQGKI